MSDVSLIKQQERNYGIDLLRVIAMIMIVVFHVITGVGILDSFKNLSPKWFVSWITYLCVYCGVDVYALISGYVGVKAKYKFSNIVYLWIQVVFYLVTISVIFAVFKKVKTYSIISILMPVTSDTYWYFSAYFCLFLFMPILNCALNTLSQKRLQVLIVAILFATSVLSRFNGEIFNLRRGFSALWLIVLYLVGGYLKLYNPLKRVKKIVLIFFLLGSMFLTMATKVILENTVFGAKIKNTGFVGFWAYNSITIVLISVVLVTIFAGIKFSKKPIIISFFAPLTFGVYIIHNNDCFARQFISGHFKNFSSFNPVLLFFAIIATSFAIFLICSFIDYIRLILFKLLRIKQNLLIIEKRLKRTLLK